MLPVSWDSVPVVVTGISSTPRSDGVPGLLCRVPQKVTRFSTSLQHRGVGGEGLFPAQIAFICEGAAARKVSYQGVALPKLCSILLHLTLRM